MHAEYELIWCFLAIGSIPLPQYGMAPHQQSYYPQASGRDHSSYHERQIIPYGPREINLYQGYNMAPRGFHFDRPTSRRQNAVKIPGRPRNNNSTASSHNYVDVDKIHEGADVRTTVRLFDLETYSPFECARCIYLRTPGHASQHSQQTFTGTTEGNRRRIQQLQV